MIYFRFFSSLCTACFVFICAVAAQDTSRDDDFSTAPEEDATFFENDMVLVKDPFGGYNRFMFSFNEKVFDYVLEPVSKGYDFLVPKKIQGSVDNFFTNVHMPVRFTNCLLQFKFGKAVTELGRFLINCTIGIGGFFDPAQAAFNLEVQDEDFGQTLGYYGLGSGPYLVLPFFGPSTLRDAFGVAGDVALSPLTWFPVYEVYSTCIARGIGAENSLNKFSYKVRDGYLSLRKSAIDPYIAIQHAYIQNRRKKVKE